MPRRDLSLAEQAHVLSLVRMLHVQLGSWLQVERALPMSHSVLAEVIAGRSEVSTTLAFRVAKVLDVSLHHVLTGTALLPGTCRHGGMPVEGEDENPATILACTCAGW